MVRGQGKSVLAELGSGGMAGGVFGHEQVVKDQTGIGCEPASHGGNRITGFGVQVEHADGESAQSGSILGTVAGADAAAVFVPGHIEHMVTAILDAPVTAVVAQHGGWAGLLGGATGDAQRHLDAALP